VEPAEVIETLFGPGMGQELFRQRVALFETVRRWYGAHDFVGNANVSRLLLGRAPNSFRTFVQREFEALTAPTLS
jgi:hypothetical protein